MSQWLRAAQAAEKEIPSPKTKGTEGDKSPFGCADSGAIQSQADLLSPFVPSVLGEGGEKSDPDTLADHLQAKGPRTYGAAASELGWGASRAWRADAELVRSGRAIYDQTGHTTLTEVQA